MDPVSFRRREGWSQAELARKLGVNSRSYICELESGRQPWPLHLALRLQKISAGIVSAAEICPEAAELLPVAPAARRPARAASASS